MVNVNKVQAFGTLYDIEDANALHTSDLIQATGTSTTAVMSQKAITDALDSKASNTALANLWNYTSNLESIINALNASVESLEARVQVLEESGSGGYTVHITSNGYNEVQCIVNGQNAGTITDDGQTLTFTDVVTIKFINTYADGCYIDIYGDSYYLSSGGEETETFTITSDTDVSITNAY